MIFYQKNEYDEEPTYHLRKTLAPLAGTNDALELRPLPVCIHASIVCIIVCEVTHTVMSKITKMGDLSFF